MKKKILLFVTVFACALSLQSQEIFTKINAINYKSQIVDNPSKSQHFKLNTSLFVETVSSVRLRNQQKKSNVVIKLPNENGDLEAFRIFEISILGKQLSTKYQKIKSYVGKSVKGSSTVRFSYSPSQGFVGAISNHKNSTILIKPTDLRSETYVSYLRNNTNFNSDFDCETINQIKKKTELKTNSLQSNDSYLRKYRVAIATTGEFSNFFLDGSESSDTEKKEKVLAAINTSLTRINGIFERDFSISLELVPNNDELLYLNANTDPFTVSFNRELQNTLDSVIGDENYDVGHMFGYENRTYGNAGCIACVCTSGSKGSGFTVHIDPSSDDFNMIASHEFGHQFGGYHVQSSSNCRSSAGLQEVEPGSGSSIMGYAGICSPNVQQNADDYFNYVDIRDIIQWTRNDSSCAELISTENTNPQVNAGIDYIIPISTAYVLEGKANDIDDEDILSYCWEQNNPEDPRSNFFPSSDWVVGPLYRSKLPVSNPVRYMPQLSDVLSGNLTPTWEVTPSVSRVLNFVLTVRDNALVGARTASDEMKVTVDARFGPFTVTSQSAAQNWNIGDTKTINWDVANTNQAPISAENVDILLSVDGGFTYPYVIAKNVINDGSEEIIVPEIENTTTAARIMVKASNNIFFAVNQSNINIQASNYLLSFNSDTQEVCGSNTVNYTFTYNTISGFNEQTTFSLTNVPDGISATFTPESATENGTVINLEIENTSNFSVGENQFEISGVSSVSNIIKKTKLYLNRFENNITEPVLSFPSNNASNVETSVLLQWESDVNVEDYTVEVSLENDFSNILDSATVQKNTYSPFNITFSTNYFWRVKASNSCGETNFSDIHTFTTECEVPEGVSVSNLAVNSATISWIEKGNADSWEVEVVEKGTTPTGSGDIVSERKYTAENLTSSTEYDVYVRSLCDDTNSSEWLEPFSFSTLTNFCDGERFYDSGGINGDYDNDEFSLTVVSPNNADVVEVTFLSFDLSGGDWLYVFDGDDSDAPFLGSYTGNRLPPVFRSSFGNNLAFYFLSGSSGVSSGWEAEVNCITISCPAPNNLIATNIQAKSIDLDWSVNGDESSWEIEYGEYGFQLGTGTKVTTTEKSLTLENLKPSTSYVFYVRAICGENPGEDDSFWSTPVFVETPCGVYDAPYFEDLENIDFVNRENCWVFNPEEYRSGYFWASRTSKFYDEGSGPAKAKSGSSYFASKYYYSADTDREAMLTTPDINIEPLNTPVLNFYSYMYGANIGSLHVDIYNNGIWTEDVFVLTGQQQTTHTDLWDEHFVDLDDYQGIVKVRFRTKAGNGRLIEIDIDDIGVIEKPTCPSPTDLSADNVTGNSVDLTWTINGQETKWQVEYGEQNYIPGQGTKELVTSNSFTLNGLQPVSDYDIYIKAICGENPEEDDSKWVGPISIETLCGTFTAPFAYDLESIPYSGDVYDCWSTNPDNESGKYFWNTLSARSFSAPRTGPRISKNGRYHFGTTSSGYRIQEGDKALLLSPLIDITNLVNPVLDFHSFMYGENVGSLHIDIFNQGVWTDDVFVIDGEQQDDSLDLWQQQIVDLSEFSDVIQIRFRAVAGGDNLIEIDIDEINVHEMPTCLNPSDFEVTNVTFESAELNWSAKNEESQWQIEYVKRGYFLGSGTKVTATTNPFTLEGLDSETYYDIYIRAICGTNLEDDNSNWVGPVSIETPCGIFEAPYFHNVEEQTSGFVDQCWDVNISASSNYSWDIKSYGNEGDTGPLRAKSGFRYFAALPRSFRTEEEVTELITPSIDISSLDNPVLDFYSFMFGENVGSLHVDVLSNGAWTEDVLILEGQQQTDPSDFWAQNLVDLSNYSGIVQVRFRAISGGTYNCEIDIDDIKFNESPTCLNLTDITATNITYNSVDLSWISTGTETQWQVEYGTQGYSVGNGTQVSATINPFTLQGLDSETAYDIYVKAVCGDNPGVDDSDFIGPISIETPCGIFDSPYTYDVENQPTRSIDDCWITSGQAESNYYWNTASSPFYERSTGPYQAKSGNNYFVASPNRYETTGQVATLISPLINTSNLTVPALEFFSFMYGENVDALHVDVKINDIWENDLYVITGQQQTTPRDNWHRNTINLSDYKGIIQLRFRAISGSTYDCEIALEDVSIIEMPTCPTPLHLAAQNILDTSVALTWDVFGDEQKWEIEYGESGFNLGEGTRVLANSNPFNVTNLNTYTNYDFYLRAVCGENPDEDDSDWIGPTQIKTLPNYCNGDRFYDSGGANGNYVDNENETTVIAPISSTFVEVEFIDFDLESCCDRLSIYDGPDVNSPFLGGFSGRTLPGKFVSTHPSGALTFVFRSDVSSTGRGWEAKVNCVTITCPKPINFEVSEIKQTEVSLNWEAGDEEQKWEIEYGEKGFDLGSGTKILADTTSYTISDLIKYTDYDFYLKAVCGENSGDDDSEWLQPISIKTLPNFCDGDRFYDSGGADANYSDNENEVTVIAPISGDYVEVEFLEFDMESCCDRLLVFDGPDVDSPSLGNYSGTTLPGKFISTHPSGALTFLFISDSSATGKGWEAQVNCLTSSCPIPTNIEISNLKGKEVTLNWDAGADEEKWQIEYGFSGFSIGNGNRVDVTTNPYTLRNLNAVSSYDFYIRAVCEEVPGTDDSLWDGPYVFETLRCDLQSTPFYENFTELSKPDCWQEGGSESWKFSTRAGFDARTAGDNSPSGNTNYAWIDGSYPNGGTHTSSLYTPWIDISNLSEPELSFSLFSVNNLDLRYNTLKVMLHPEGEREIIEIFRIQGSTEKWKTYTFDLKKYNTNSVSIEFSVTENSTGNPAYNDILLDEIKIDEKSVLSTSSNNLSNFVYYPSPVQNELTIKSNDAIEVVKIFNAIGQNVYHEAFAKKIDEEVKIDMSSLAVGTYLVKVISDTKVSTFRIVKNNR